MTLDVEVIRKDFPIFETHAHGKRLVYLDSAATSQKPRQVIDRIVTSTRHENANVHRGVYELGEKATAAYEGAREAVARFIGAHELSLDRLHPRDDRVDQPRSLHVGSRERRRGRRDPRHRDGAPLEPDPVAAAAAGDRGDAAPSSDRRRRARCASDLLDEYITDRTKLVGVSLMSNVLGTINPVRQLADAAHAVGASIVVDAAQARAAPRASMSTNSTPTSSRSRSHKMCGPTGAGVLYGREDLLEEMPPFHGGGEMIREVWADRATWNEIPYKFEAGTPNIAQAVGMGAAIEYLEGLGMDAVREHEIELTVVRDRPADESGRDDLRPAGRSERGRSRLVQPRRGSSARSGHDRGPGRRLHTGRAPLRAAADASAGRSRNRPGFVLHLQHARRRGCADRCARESERDGSHEPRGALQRSDPRSLPGPTEQGPARSARRRARAQQPSVRRRDRALPEVRRRRRRGHRVRGQGLLDLPGRALR